MTYNVGDNITLSCSTDLNFDSITWSMGGATLASSNVDSELSLNVAVSSDVNAKNITCRIESAFGTQSREITVTVIPTEESLLLPAVIGGAIGGSVLLLVILILALLCCFFFGARYVMILSIHF